MDDAPTDRAWSGSAASYRLTRRRGSVDGGGDDADGEASLTPRYRRGRGGYDAEAAAAAAQAKYVFRQRMVAALVLLALATGLFAGGLGLAEGWYAHAATDVCLLGYLVYLRRQVRVEQAIRARRATRMAGTRIHGARAAAGGYGSEPNSLDGLIPDNLGLAHHAPDPRRRRATARRRRTVAEEVAARAAACQGAAGGAADPETETRTDAAEETDESAAFECDTRAEPCLDDERDGDIDDVEAPEALDEPALPRLQPAPLPERPRGTIVLELDDEDPELHDLDSQLRRGYRPAAGQ